MMSTIEKFCMIVLPISVIFIVYHIIDDIIKFDKWIILSISFVVMLVVFGLIFILVNCLFKLYE